MKKLFVIAGIGTLMFAFQNCQQASTASASNDSLAKPEGQLIAVTANDPEDASGTIVQPAADDGNTDSTPVTSDSGTSAANQPSGPGNSQGHGKGPEAPGAKDASGEYVCILDGPGKSVKLGLTAGVPAGQNPIPSVLCMSKNACLNIASQVMVVKGPEFRGYCKLPHGNPHVTHITDAQLQVKVDALKPKP